MSKRLFSLLLALVLMAGLLLPATRASAAPSWRAWKWTEHYFPSADGITMLHADVLRPRGLGPKGKTPVILSVSPYFNHGDTAGAGPSPRFFDFLELSGIIDRGYTYVMVDLPGFGGSAGCNDWGGVREQEGVKSAVEWAASRPWSTGRVGMIGKSYDGWTGLMGMAQNPKGLAAVVSMEPVYAGYRYLYNNGVRFLNSVLTPAIFQVYDAQPGDTDDGAMYTANGAPQAWCYGVNLGLQQIDDPDSIFWQERDLLRLTKKSKVPLFLTQGFLETNTKPDGAFDFFNGLPGRHNRAWFGQFDHVRGWEMDGDELATGRRGFVREVMRFFDRYVKRVPLKRAPVHKDPNMVVQDARGRYRAEAQWPPADARLWWSKLKPGSYTDEGLSSSRSSDGVWSISQPLPHDAWLSGEPVLKVALQAVPRANLVGNVYDVSPGGRATLVSRGTWLVRGAADQVIKFDLYGQDWPIAKGHRIAVRLSSSNRDWWTHIPTFTPVTVKSARIGLPFLRFERTRFLSGGPTPRLKGHLQSEVLELSKQAIRSASKRFSLPPRLRTR